MNYEQHLPFCFFILERLWTELPLNTKGEVSGIHAKNVSLKLLECSRETPQGKSSIWYNWDRSRQDMAGKVKTILQVCFHFQIEILWVQSLGLFMPWKKKTIIYQAPIKCHRVCRYFHWKYANEKTFSQKFNTFFTPAALSRQSPKAPDSIDSFPLC